MRRKVFVLIVGILLFSAFLLSAGSAETVQKTLEVSCGGIEVWIDGVRLWPTDAGGNLVEPFIYEGTTYLPARAIAEALGKNVEWDGDSKIVTISGERYDEDHPAPMGATQKIFVYYEGDGSDDYVGGYELALTVTESCRGAEAYRRLLDTNEKANEPPAGMEYILVKMRAEVLVGEGGRVITLSEEPFWACPEGSYERYQRAEVIPPEPAFYGKVYPTGVVEGYLVFLVNREDLSPVLCFSGGNVGDLYFKMTK